MIISASRRTDLPAFYGQWLANRLRAGFCTVPNPFNPRQVARISLRPREVDAIVFWTRDAWPLWPVLDQLDAAGYRYYFQYTLTGYGFPVEPRAPGVEQATETMTTLAQRRPGSVVWRFDPLLVGPAFPNAMHLSRFTTIARRLAGEVSRVVTSVVSIYQKTERRLGRLYRWGEALSRDPARESSVVDLLGALVNIAREFGMGIEACAQPEDWTDLGVQKTRCIDDRLLGELYGGTWPHHKDPGQRADCACIPSKDIGMVDTCAFGCVYCYATVSDEVAQRRMGAHDPMSPSLFGNHAPTAAASAQGTLL